MNQFDVFAAVARDLAHRDAIGWANHRKRMLADDPERDWLQEAYEEALDMSAYLKAEILLRSGNEVQGTEEEFESWPSLGVKVAVGSVGFALAVLAIVGGFEWVGW